MKQLLLAAAVCAAIGTPIAASAAEPTPAYTVTGNLAVVSDYRFRGISQSYNDPAVQGGIDFAHESGFYLGNWNSSVSGNSLTDGAGIEMDFYGGFKPVVGDFTFDIGGLYYYYPGAETRTGSEKFNTFEGYLGVAYGPVSFKAWYAFTDWFGVNKDSGYEDDTDGSVYYEANGSFPLMDKLTLVAHIGYQDVKGNSGDLDYTDYKLGLTYDLSGWLLGAAVVGTDADDDWYYATRADGSDKKDTGKTTIVVSVSKTF